MRLQHTLMIIPRIAAILAFVAATTAARADLAGYIGNGDKTFDVKIENKREVGGSAPYTALDMTLSSQNWRGLVWKHSLTIIRPKELARPDSAILMITGGANAPGGEPVRKPNAETLLLAQVAVKVRTVAVVLNQVPNQPILDGRSEDAAIAYTFDKFIETKEADWPLLFPMVKSAIRAMDAAQQVGKSELDVDLKRFFVTGASKRGWTTWLTGASDPRVFAIAPMVIDNLNMPKQMPHQLESWGKFSDMIQDYTVLNIQTRAQDPAIAGMLASVDPYSMLDRLKMPKLMVNGTNDPYWVVDASRYYFDELKGERYIHYVPNAGHGLGEGAAEAIGAFYVMTRDDMPRPRIEWKTGADGDHIDFDLKVDQQPVEVRLWQASTSPDKDFRDEPWIYTLMNPTGQGSFGSKLGNPGGVHTAFYAELRFKAATGDEFGLCTPIKVIDDKEDSNGASSSLGD